MDALFEILLTFDMLQLKSQEKGSAKYLNQIGLNKNLITLKLLDIQLVMKFCS